MVRSASHPFIENLPSRVICIFPFSVAPLDFFYRNLHHYKSSSLINPDPLSSKSITEKPNTISSSPPSHRRGGTSLARYLILNKQLSSNSAAMNAYAQQDQSGAYGSSDPSGNYGGGYGFANAYPPDPSQQHPGAGGASPYAQNPSRQQQHPGSEYGGGPQKPPPGQTHQGDGYDPEGTQGLQDKHEDEPEPEEAGATDGHLAEHPGEKKIAPVKKRPVPSDYSQDPYHHDLMKHYAKAASKPPSLAPLLSLEKIAKSAFRLIFGHHRIRRHHRASQELRPCRLARTRDAFASTWYDGGS